MIIMCTKLTFSFDDEHQKLLWRLAIRLSETDDLFQVSASKPENESYILVRSRHSIIRILETVTNILHFIQEKDESCYLSRDKSIQYIAKDDPNIIPTTMYSLFLFSDDKALENYQPYPFTYNPTLLPLYTTFLENFKDFSLVATKYKFCERKDFERSIFGKQGIGKVFYAKVTIHNQKEVAREIMKEASFNVRFLLNIHATDDIIDRVCTPLNRHISLTHSSLWEANRIDEIMIDLLTKKTINHIPSLKGSRVFHHNVRINNIRRENGVMLLDKLLLWVMRDPQNSDNKLIIDTILHDVPMRQNAIKLYERYGKTYTKGLLSIVGEKVIIAVMNRFPRKDVKILLEDIGENELLRLRVLAAHPYAYSDEKFSVSLPLALDYRLKCFIDPLNKNISSYEPVLEKFWESETKTVTVDELIQRFDVVNSTILSYQGKNTKNSYELRSTFFRKICPELNPYPLFKINTTSMTQIGFLSPFLARRHSVSNDRKGIISRLSESMSVAVLVFDEIEEELMEFYSKCKIVKLSYTDFKKNVETIVSLKLDGLVFCELGLDNMSYFLAHKRLAPFQITTWGHSDTSGIKFTIDGYVTSSYYYNDPDMFTEKLLVMNSLSTYYYNPGCGVPVVNEKEFLHKLNIPLKSGALWVCLQTPIKYSSSFTNVMKRILKSLPKGDTIVMMSSEHKIPGVIYVERLPFMTYLSLLSIADGFIDTFPFSGCNTTLQAFSMGLPVVTMQTNTLSGSFTAGFYKAMKYEELVTSNTEEFIEKIVKLSTDDHYRYYCKHEIQTRSEVLFQEEKSFEDWKDLIQSQCHHEEVM